MKSIENELKSIIDSIGDRDLSLEEEFIDGFKSGVEFAQRWIPVDEELPPNRETVLIKYLKDGKEKKSCGQIVLDSIEIYWQSGSWTQIPVTHWRPIELS
jgi:hypothetical protein